MEKFVFLEHMADIQFAAFGLTLDEVFSNCVLAVASYVNGGKTIHSSKGKVVEVQGQDKESLLCNFLDEILYLMDSEHFVTSRAEITLRGNNLKAELYGDDTKNYTLSHIKAATYAEMEIKKNENGWVAQVVMDV